MQGFWLEILQFTLLQAFLSAGGAMIIGLVLARALYYYPGLRLKGALLSLGELIFVMPVMVASLAFLLIFEKSYGLYAIVVVHIFLNAFYAMGQILKGYEGFLSQAQHQQGQLLRLTRFEVIKYLEAPGISPMISQVFLVVFCLCLSSFSSILLLGGGPAATTLSVALYHSLSVAFDLQSAFFFLSLQVALSLVFALLLAESKKPPKAVVPFKRELRRSWLGDIVLGGILFFYAFPLLVLLTTVAAIPSDLGTVVNSSVLTVVLGLGTGALTIVISVALLSFYLTQGKPLKMSFSVIVTAFLSLPKIALVGSFFLFAHAFLDTFLKTYLLIILVGVVCYLPFVLKSLLQGFKGLQSRYSQQIQLLSMSFKDVVTLIVWPHLRPHIIKKFSFVTCFAMGNLSVPLLLGQMEVQTLPVLSYQALLRYDTELSGFYLLCLLILMALVMVGILKRNQDVTA